MRHISALSNRIIRIVAMALLLAMAAGTVPVQAQIAFDELDWTTDRGGVLPFYGPGPFNSVPRRQGYNNFKHLLNGTTLDNNPTDANLKWVYPANINRGTIVPVDNTFSNGTVKSDPAFTNPVDDSSARVSGNGWVYPTLAQRSGNGFSFVTDPNNVAFGDYFWVTAKHGDFFVQRSGNTSPITADELAALPNVPANVYSAVNTALIASQNGTDPIATWASGTNNMAKGNYFVDIHTPGAGTVDGAGVVRPIVNLVLVRLSWGANANDPTKSRIFAANVSELAPQLPGEIGWIRVQASGVGPAELPYDGVNQLRVTLYGLTPADTTSGNGTPYASPPIVTADAVRFVPIERGARILGPAVSAKISANATDAAPQKFYFAREESLADFTIRSRNDPTLPAGAGNAEIADPTASTTVPVFYCVENLPNNLNITLGTYSAAERLVWRYVGAGDLNSGTVSASGVLADVRCRAAGGTTVVKTILYFVTTNAAGLGRVYALDPVGNPNTVLNPTDPSLPINQEPLTKQTQCYWAYPSIRPLTPNDVANRNVPGMALHDPNYTGFEQDPLYPVPAVADTTNANEGSYRDGDLIPEPAPPAGNVVGKVIRADTHILSFGGGQGAPVVVDDPADTTKTKPQILIVGTVEGASSGHVYAFDAGGRGDYVANYTADPTLPFYFSQNIAGTTQRFWTWPRLGPDMWRSFTQAALQPTTPNTYANDPTRGAFPTSPSYEPTLNANESPVMFGSTNGHLYAISPRREAITGTTFEERLEWQFPGSSKSLKGALSQIAVYKVGAAWRGYFTATGRIYSIPLTPTGGYPTPGNTPATIPLGWVYPYSANWPDATAVGTTTDPNTLPFDPDFGGSAPIVVDAAQIITGQTGSYLYAIQSDGTVRMLDAVGNFNTNKTSLTASGLGPDDGFTSTTVSNPILTLIRRQDDNTDVTDYPTVAWTDDSGAANAVNAVPQTLLDAAANYLEPLWQQDETGIPRVASPILSNAFIASGDTGGVMRAYSVGPATVDSGEPVGGTRAPGYVSIDLRTINAYNKSDWDQMMLSADNGNAAKTPAHNSTGGNFASTATPLISPFTNDVLGPFAEDWGNTVYVAMSGVYYCQWPTGNATTSPSVPTVTVNVRVGAVAQPPITVPLIDESTGPAPSLPPMPDDFALRNQDGFSILGKDPADGNVKTYTNRNGNGNGVSGVFPWVARFKVLVSPAAGEPFVPGLFGSQISASATITQDNIHLSGNQVLGRQTGLSYRLRLGQNDYKGLNNNNSGIARRRLLGRGRLFYKTHPLALTVRGFKNLTDQTGTGLAFNNMIGWAGDVTRLGNIATAAEMIDNGNRIVNASITNVNDPTRVTGVRPIFAPLGFVPQGTGKIYTGVDANLNQIPAMYIMDRSNMWAGAGRNLSVRTYSGALRFLAGNDSNAAANVMNPLPWETMPNSDFNSPDYPAIGSDNLVVNLNGQDAMKGEAYLTPPTQDASGDPKFRTPVPMSTALTLNVPKYQPANVNRGQIKGQYNGQALGTNYVDISGVTRGEANNNPMIGPMQAESTNSANAGAGAPVAENSTIAMPSGGYLSEVLFVVQPAGAGASTLQYTPSAIFAESNYETPISSARVAYRAMEIGAAVPPDIKLSVSEDTVDLGNLPHSAGYSYPISSNDSYDFLFAPSGLGTWRGNAAGSPWNDDNQIGNFFRPITVNSDSNINLVNLRAAKATGYPGQPFYDNKGNLLVAPIQLASDQVSGNVLTALAATGVSSGTGAGNIGLVTSFDHTSTKNPPDPEHNLWPVTNPNVTTTMVVGPQTWFPASGSNPATQAQPSLHKPLPGDGQGTFATIPDRPHNVAFDASAYVKPQVGFGVPLGTPVGTYSNPIYIFEDWLPDQWREWLTTNKASADLTNLAANDDGLFNIPNSATDTSSPSLKPLEAYSDPTFTLKLRVTEARLTGLPISDNDTKSSIQRAIGKGYGGAFWNVDSMLANGNLNGNFSLGANLLPAGYSDPTAAGGSLHLLWTTNRQPINSPSLNGATRLPTASAPWGLAYSALNGIVLNGQHDVTFATHNGYSSQWWNPTSLFPGYDNATGQPANYTALFPSVNTTLGPGLPGTVNPLTVRYASPAIAQDTGPLGDPTQIFVFWQGNADKTGNSASYTDSRTFYAKVINGVPQAGTIVSFLNDPALTKLSPKPLLVTLPAANGFGKQKVMFLFWHAGNQSNTSLYFNVNVADAGGNFQPGNWSPDQKLPTPSGLSWQSDPTAIYRIVKDPNNTNNYIDALDVVYTGVLKNRQNVETLLTRYMINRGSLAAAPGVAANALTVITLPPVDQETLTHAGRAGIYTSRDASWYLGRSQTDFGGRITLTLKRNGAYTQLIGVGGNTGGGPNQRGRFDAASGLAYFDSALGGQLVVDVRSGTIMFPNAPPKETDQLLVTYTPQVMRLSAVHNETNVLRETLQTPWDTDAAFSARQATTTPGDSSNPIVILDHGAPNAAGVPLNPRLALSSPQVIFFPGPSSWPARTDRLWVLYRKSDPTGTTPSSLYYKAMRLMVKLPRPVKLTVVGGVTKFANLQVSGNTGPYEVDYARGRLYFTEVDEGSTVTVNYTAWSPQGLQQTITGLQYRVAWGDEISATSQDGDETTPETVLPTLSAVNEGQATAFKDPIQDKLWVFWTSTRAGSTDLYYMTVAPRFYPVVSGEK